VRHDIGIYQQKKWRMGHSSLMRCELLDSVQLVIKAAELALSRNFHQAQSAHSHRPEHNRRRFEDSNMLTMGW